MPVATHQKIAPFLWFNDNAEDAARFYVSVFPNSKIVQVYHFPDGAPMPKGTVMTVAFELDGLGFTAMNGGPGVQFNQAVSFVVLCQTQAELDQYWEKLTSGGGEPVRCGWLRDRFGLSWQIVPANLPQLVNGPNGAKVLQALWQMGKLDMAVLEDAANGR